MKGGLLSLSPSHVSSQVSSFPTDPGAHLLSFYFILEVLLWVICNIVLMVMNYLRFHSQENSIILILFGRFLNGSEVICWHIFSLRILTIPFHCLCLPLFMHERWAILCMYCFCLLSKFPLFSVSLICCIHILCSFFLCILLWVCWAPCLC